MWSDQEDHRQQRDVAVQRVDEEARPARRAQAAHVDHAERDRERQQQQRDGARRARQVPVGARPGAGQQRVHAARASSWPAVACAGQSPTVVTRRRGRPGGPAARAAASHAGAASPRTKRGGRGDVGIGAGGGGDAHGAPHAPRGPSRGGVDDVVHARARRGSSAARRCSRWRGRPSRIETVWPRRRGVAAVVVGDADPPAAGRRRPGGGDVAAEADEHSAAARPRRPSAARSAAQALAVAPRSSRTPAGIRIQPVDAIEAHLAPAGANADPHRRGPRRCLGFAILRGRREQPPVAVIAGQLERPADRRVDVAAGQLGRAQGHLERFDAEGQSPASGGRRARSAATARSPRESGCRRGRSRRALTRPRRAPVKGRPESLTPSTAVEPSASQLANAGSPAAGCGAANSGPSGDHGRGFTARISRIHFRSRIHCQMRIHFRSRIHRQMRIYCRSRIYWRSLRCWRPSSVHCSRL